MTSWTEEGGGDDSDVSVENLGRALGGTILNGWQLNQSNSACMYALENPTFTPPANWHDTCGLDDRGLTPPIAL